MDDLPAVTLGELRRRVSASVQCAHCGYLFEAGHARSKLRAHLLNSRECRRAVQRMVREQVKVGRAVRLVRPVKQ